MATILQSLKVSTVQRHIDRSPTQHRRDRLLNIINEQMEAAAAHAEGKPYVVTVNRKVLNKFNGEKTTVNVPKRFRQCWWSADDGKTYMQLRYGSKTLEIAKGKTTIEVGEFSKLVPTLELIRDAVLLGEFDDLLSSASSRLAAQLRARRKSKPDN